MLRKTQTHSRSERAEAASKFCAQMQLPPPPEKEADPSYFQPEKRSAVSGFRRPAWTLILEKSTSATRLNALGLPALPSLPALPEVITPEPVKKMLPVKEPKKTRERIRFRIGIDIRPLMSVVSAIMHSTGSLLADAHGVIKKIHVTRREQKQIRSLPLLSRQLISKCRRDEDLRLWLLEVWDLAHKLAPHSRTPEALGCSSKQLFAILKAAQVVAGASPPKLP